MKRLHALDTLRGVAALAIVIWHWQHFYAVSGDWADGWQRSDEPLYWLLKPLYEAGWAAVDLFFPLSGFIFFWLYGAAIREKRIGAGTFAWLRFSRLYPLHLVTLIVVAAMQFFFFRATGSFFIYEANDAQHFASGLVMAQQWLPPTLAQSFNGPAWSVSVEVLLYCLFFAACRLGFKGFWPALAVAVLAIPFLWWNEFIGRGLMGFFLGGAVFALDEKILARPDAKPIARTLGWVALALWALAAAEAYLGPAHALLGSAVTRNFYLLLFIFCVSPVTILALALREQVLGASWAKMSFLGDISYSTYLLHFPMQLALALVAAHYDLGPETFENLPALALFYIALICIGVLSFRFFERPMQNLLRGRR